MGEGEDQTLGVLLQQGRGQAAGVAFLGQSGGGDGDGEFYAGIFQGFGQLGIKRLHRLGQVVRVVGLSHLDIVEVALGGIAGMFQQDLIKAQFGQLFADADHILSGFGGGDVHPADACRVLPVIAAVGADGQGIVLPGGFVVLKAGYPGDGIKLRSGEGADGVV